MSSPPDASPTSPGAPAEAPRPNRNRSHVLSPADPCRSPASFCLVWTMSLVESPRVQPSASLCEHLVGFPYDSDHYLSYRTRTRAGNSSIAAPTYPTSLSAGARALDRPSAPALPCVAAEGDICPDVPDRPHAPGPPRSASLSQASDVSSFGLSTPPAAGEPAPSRSPVHSTSVSAQLCAVSPSES